MALHHNLTLFNSNISATPIKVRSLMHLVCPTAEFDRTKVEKYNKYAGPDDKKLVKDHCVFKNFKIDSFRRESFNFSSDDDRLSDRIEIKGRLSPACT